MNEIETLINEMKDLYKQIESKKKRIRELQIKMYDKPHNKHKNKH